jgi:cell wall-associated NlpC family hydrolase
MGVLSNSYTRFSLLIRFGIIILAVSTLTTSCSTAQKQKPVVYSEPRRVVKTPVPPRGNNIENSILDQYQRWKGTPHQLGGAGSRGIDCSGFVMAVYRDAFSIKLHRTTQSQVQQGKSVSLNELQPGDLVFFKPPDYPRHVGIYLSKSKFVHASKSKGVTISKIDEYYWGKYFWTAKRIIPGSKN